MEPAIRVAGLAPSRGAAWLVEAFALFRRKPLAWIGISVGWVVITVGLIMVPLVGGVVANFLQPVFFASFAIAAYRQSAGEDVVMNDASIAVSVIFEPDTVITSTPPVDPVELKK